MLYTEIRWSEVITTVIEYPADELNQSHVLALKQATNATFGLAQIPLTVKYFLNTHIQS